MRNPVGTSCWQATALDLGARFDMQAHPGGWSVFAVVADIDGCVVKAEGHANETRIACAAPGAAGLWFRFHRGHVYPLGRFFGVQDLQVGHVAFDDRFVVKGGDPGYARAWLVSDALPHLLRAPDYAVELDDELLTAELPALELNPDVLASAMRGLAVLGRRGTMLRDEWADLASQLGGRMQGVACWRPDGRCWIQVDDDDATTATACTIDSLRAALHGDRRTLLYTRIRARRLASDDVALPALPAEVAELDPDVVQVEDGHVAIYLVGFERSAARLTSALRVARKLAGEAPMPPSQGPFR